VVVVELLRELFRVAVVLADSAPLDGYDVGPGAGAANLPTRTVSRRV
jgi:hypothetical protein